MLRAKIIYLQPNLVQTSDSALMFGGRETALCVMNGKAILLAE
jgi:hypothetical protein